MMTTSGRHAVTSSIPSATFAASPSTSKSSVRSNALRKPSRISSQSSTRTTVLRRRPTSLVTGSTRCDLLVVGIDVIPHSDSGAIADEPVNARVRVEPIAFRDEHPRDAHPLAHPELQGRVVWNLVREFHPDLALRIPDPDSVMRTDCQDRHIPHDDRLAKRPGDVGRT